MGSKQVYKYPTKRNLTRKDMTMRERILPEGANRFEVTTSDGLTLAGWTYGDAEKPTIILVHGYPDNSCVWDGVVPLLAANWRVVTYDVRGCGESDVPAKVSDYRMAQLNADLKTIIDHVSPDEAVHVVGHDWGSIQSWNAMMDDDLKGRSFTIEEQLPRTLIRAGILEHARARDRSRFDPRPGQKLAPSTLAFQTGDIHTFSIETDSRGP